MESSSIRGYSLPKIRKSPNQRQLSSRLGPPILATPRMPSPSVGNRGLAAKGYKAVTFDMRGVGESTGKASITGSKEVQDVVDVCRWVSDNLNVDGIVLVGSSAGAPIAGSAVDKVERVVGYVGIGYPFGLMASILFGGHHKSILKSEKPKLFVMGTKDGFTSVKQLKNKLNSSLGRTETHLIEGVGHFEMEGPSYNDKMANLIAGFVESL